MDFPLVTYTPIPTADYTATVRGFEPAVGQYGPQIKWTLALGDVENVEGEIENDKTIWYFTPAEVSTKNKLGKLATACGFDFTAGIPLSSTTIVGKTIVVTVTVATREDGSPTNKISDIRRASGKSGAAKPAAAAQSVNGGDPWE